MMLRFMLFLTDVISKVNVVICSIDKLMYTCRVLPWRMCGVVYGGDSFPRLLVLLQAAPGPQRCCMAE